MRFYAASLVKLCGMLLYKNKKNDWEYDSAGNRHRKETMDRRYNDILYRLLHLIERRLRTTYCVDYESFIDFIHDSGQYNMYDQGLIEIAD